MCGKTMTRQLRWLLDIICSSSPFTNPKDIEEGENAMDGKDV